MTSLKSTAAFRAFVLDQLEDLGDVTPRSMFGGVGLYCGDLFFGIIARDVLYLKVDDVTRGDHERAGMHPFKPYPKRSGTMQYYAVPVDVLESAADLVAWARRAVGAASRAADRSRRLSPLCGPKRESCTRSPPRITGEAREKRAKRRWN
jgi:DNA transformation protein